MRVPNPKGTRSRLRRFQLRQLEVPLPIQLYLPFRGVFGQIDPIQLQNWSYSRGLKSYWHNIRALERTGRLLSYRALTRSIRKSTFGDLKELGNESGAYLYVSNAPAIEGSRIRDFWTGFASAGRKADWRKWPGVRSSAA